VIAPPVSLRRQWFITALLWIGAWLGFYLLLRPVWPDSSRWLVLSGLAMAYGLWVFRRHLPANHRPGEAELLPGIGPGNALTLLRGLCIGLIAGFLFGPWPMGAPAWVIVLLYTLADIADYFDGYLARRANHVTPLGGALDMEFDGLGTLVVILLAVSFGQLPWWYLTLGLARYLFVFGLWLRRRLGRPIAEMTNSAHRRIFAGFQMGFLSVVLWPILPRSMAVIAGTLFAAATGLSFLRDWLIVSGIIDPNGPAYPRVQGHLYRLFARQLPLIWRLFLVVCLISILAIASPTTQPEPWRDLIASWGLPGAGLLATGLALIAIIGIAFIGLGILGRLTSIALALPVGFDVATRGLQIDNGLAIVSTVFIMLLGTGPFSLWPLEERYMYQRLGER
jgi:CDP-diacylglycerol--glycerol-3-phosphate 3-phosphatidyltransferase